MLAIHHHDRHCPLPSEDLGDAMVVATDWQTACVEQIELLADVQGVKGEVAH